MKIDPYQIIKNTQEIDVNKIFFNIFNPLNKKIMTWNIHSRKNIKGKGIKFGVNGYELHNV